MKAAGIIICIGCRQRLELENLDDCSCTELEEAELAEKITELAERRCYMCGRPGGEVEIQDVFTGGPLCVGCACTPRRCYKCDVVRQLDYSVKPTEMCFYCARQA